VKLHPAVRSGEDSLAGYHIATIKELICKTRNIGVEDFFPAKSNRGIFRDLNMCLKASKSIEVPYFDC
jgi:hypothetical protein